MFSALFVYHLPFKIPTGSKADGTFWGKMILSEKQAFFGKTDKGTLGSIFCSWSIFCGSKNGFWHAFLAFAIRKFLRRQAWAHFGAQSCPSWTGKSVGCSRHLLTDQMDKTICPYRRTGDRTRSQGVNWSIDQEGSPCPPQERRLFVSDKKEKALLFEKSNRNSLLVSAEIVKFC